LISGLAHRISAEPADPTINLVIEQLYESARLQEGLLPNPAEMVGRIQQLMEAAVAPRTAARAGAAANGAEAGGAEADGGADAPQAPAPEAEISEEAPDAGETPAAP
jgi:hypothetical protein